MISTTTYLPTYLACVLCLSGSLLAQGHPPAPCHTGELWTTQFPNLSPGDFVEIPAGQTIVLNTATVDLGGLWVDGTLVFDHTVAGDTVHLNAAYVVVTGTLQIGCKLGPGQYVRFSKKASLTLIKPERYDQTIQFPNSAGVNWPAQMAARFGTSGPIYEAALDRGLVIVGGGQLYIYGNDSREQSWTTLSSTAAGSQDVVDCDDPIGGPWKVGDALVLASTDFEYPDQVPYENQSGKWGGHAAGYTQGEERSVVAVNTGSQLRLDSNLQYSHWSATTSATFPGGTDGLSEKCEIGNLTRSVVIQGESSPLSSVERAWDPALGQGLQHFGHVILIAESGLDPSCEVDWAEFRNLGVEGKLARYPFHWHELGANAAGSFLKHCSIHHCVNRFVAVHNTDSVILEDNVGYATLGTGFFLEDADANGAPIGDQVQNVVLRNNLGLAVGRPGGSVDLPQLYQDLDRVQPSVFWIQHPNQQVEGNHAAGAVGHGFYLAPNQLADGYSHPASGASYFRNNVAHGNGQHGFYHQSRVKWGWASGDAPAGEGLVAWKNRRYGIWWRTYGVSLLSGCKVADNKSGIYPASEGRQNAADGVNPPTCRLTVADGLVFGETPNAGVAVNAAEQAAQRSLPQTYWNFTRPDPLADMNEQKWDTLNAVEVYDGRSEFTGLKIGYFPASRTLPNPGTAGGTALQSIAAFTQVEYNSKFAEDPRNLVRSLQFASGAGEQVVNAALDRSTLAALGNSMIRNTVLYDADGSLGYGANAYLCYDDPFFEANATGLGTHDTARNLLILPTGVADFAQFEVDATLSSGFPQLTVAVQHQSGGTSSQTLGVMPGGPTRDYAFNAPIGLDTDPQTNREGIYTCTFGGPVPTAYEIKIQFAEAALLPTIIGVPLASLGPIGVRLNGVQVSDTEPSRDALLNSAFPNAYFFDSANSMIYIRTTTTIIPPGGSADVDGTRNVLEVN